MYKLISFSKRQNYSFQNGKKSLTCISFIAKCLMLNDSSMNGTSNTFYVQYTAHKDDLNREKDQNSFNSL